MLHTRRVVLDSSPVAVDSSYHLLVMDASPQLLPGANCTTSTIVPRIQRTHRQRNRTSIIHGTGRAPVCHLAPLFGNARYCPIERRRVSNLRG